VTFRHADMSAVGSEALRRVVGSDDANRLERILGRPERPLPLDEPLARLAGKRVLITGAEGSIGSAVAEIIGEAAEVIATDKHSGNPAVDVRVESDVAAAFKEARPEVIFHLAAAKSAPDGERDPMSALEVNVLGTRNVLAHAPEGCHVITASTCKACEPETAYGASKLVAERVTLNAGGSVARFYNVVESSGNVFEIWEQLDPNEPIAVTPCRRYFISLAEAVSLVVWTAILPPARYGFDPGKPREMHDVAADLYPGRTLHSVPPRRGDRIVEPLAARHEQVEQDARPSLLRIVGAHDLTATDDRLEPAVRRLVAH
jgi:FlaA1/EpsC-like NDP-sugar epimerase